MDGEGSIGAHGGHVSVSSQDEVRNFAADEPRSSSRCSSIFLSESPVLHRSAMNVTLNAVDCLPAFDRPTGPFSFHSHQQHHQHGDIATLDRAPSNCSSSGRHSVRSGGSSGCSPPQYKWARSLSFVLNDFDGESLFRAFLQEEQCAPAIDFHYAIQALRNDAVPINQRISILIPQIYTRFLSSKLRTPGIEYTPLMDIPNCISEEARLRVSARLKAIDADRSCVVVNIDIYDEIYGEVYAFLQRKHQVFSRSENFIDYLRQSADDQNDGMNWISSVPSASWGKDNGARSATSTLPSLNAEINIELKTVPPPLPPRSTRPRGKATPPSSFALPKDAFNYATHQHNRKKITGGNEQQISSLPLTMLNIDATINARTNATQPPPKASGARNPYHTDYAPDCPPSMKDSAVSSALSSDVPNNSRSHRLHNIRNEHADRNRTRNDQIAFIPRAKCQQGSQKDPQASSDNPSVRQQWAHGLIAKLEKVEREQERSQQLDATLQGLLGPHEEDKRAVMRRFRERDCAKFSRDDPDAIINCHLGSIGWNNDTRSSPSVQVRSPGGAQQHFPGHLPSTSYSGSNSRHAHSTMAPVANSFQPMLFTSQPRRSHNRGAAKDFVAHKSKSPDSRNSIRAPMQYQSQQKNQPNIMTTSMPASEANQVFSSFSAFPQSHAANQLLASTTTGAFGSHQRSKMAPSPGQSGEQRRQMQQPSKTAKIKTDGGSQRITSDSSGFISGGSTFSSAPPASQQYKNEATQYDEYGRGKMKNHRSATSSAKAAALRGASSANDESPSIGMASSSVTLPGSSVGRVKVYFFMSNEPETEPYTTELDANANGTTTVRQLRLHLHSSCKVKACSLSNMWFKVESVEPATGGAAFTQVESEHHPVPLFRGNIILKIRSESSD